MGRSRSGIRRPRCSDRSAPTPACRWRRLSRLKAIPPPAAGRRWRSFGPGLRQAARQAKGRSWPLLLHPDFEILDETKIEGLLPIRLWIEQFGCDQEIVDLLVALGGDDPDAQGRRIPAVDGLVLLEFLDRKVDLAIGHFGIVGLDQGVGWSRILDVIAPAFQRCLHKA